MPKTYLLVGLTGSGKSTAANCIFNQSGDQKLVKDLPFNTSDNSKGCTQVFAHAGNDKIMVLDTVGKNKNDNFSSKSSRLKKFHFMSLIFMSELVLETIDP